MAAPSLTVEFNAIPKDPYLEALTSKKTPLYFTCSPFSRYYDEEKALQNLDSGKWDEFNLYEKPEHLVGRYDVTESLADCDAYRGSDGFYKPDDFMDVGCDVLDENNLIGKYKTAVAAEPYETDAEYDAKKKREHEDPDWELPTFDFPRLYRVKIKCWKVTRLGDARPMSGLEKFLKQEAESFWSDYEWYVKMTKEDGNADKKRQNPKKKRVVIQEKKRSQRTQARPPRPQPLSTAPPSAPRRNKNKGPDADGWYKA